MPSSHFTKMLSELKDLSLAFRKTRPSLSLSSANGWSMEGAAETAAAKTQRKRSGRRRRMGKKQAAHFFKGTAAESTKTSTGEAEIRKDERGTVLCLYR